jgi:hypothetical protein
MLATQDGVPSLRRLPSRCATFLGVALLLIAVANPAHAGCAFPHPLQAKIFRSSLVAAFVSCGGYNTPNATTESGIPSCAPPATYDQEGGSLSDGWQWMPTKGFGDLTMKVGANEVTGLTNVDPSDVRDVAFTLRLHRRGEPRPSRDRHGKAGLGAARQHQGSPRR